MAGRLLLVNPDKSLGDTLHQTQTQAPRAAVFAHRVRALADAVKVVNGAEFPWREVDALGKALTAAEYADVPLSRADQIAVWNAAPFAATLLALIRCGVADEIAGLAAGTNDRLQRVVAYSPHVKATTRERILRERSETNRAIRTAKKRGASAMEIEAAVGHPDWRIRRRAAKRADLSAAQQDRLAHDPEHKVRSGLASNPKAGEDVLGLLAMKDGHAATRFHALCNPATPAAARQNGPAGTMRERSAYTYAFQRGGKGTSLGGVVACALLGSSVRYLLRRREISAHERLECVAQHADNPQAVQIMRDLGVL